MCAVVVAGCQQNDDAHEPTAQETAVREAATKENTVQYGEALTLAEVTPISDILADPKSFVGKKVRIEGQIKDVCPMKGCWIEIEGPDGQTHLTVKVEDGEIVFTPDTKGKQAIAEGEVYQIDLDKEQAMSYMKHLADEKGEAFDSTSVTGPMVIYQIKGSGAEVLEAGD